MVSGVLTPLDLSLPRSEIQLGHVLRDFSVMPAFSSTTGLAQTTLARWMLDGTE